MAAPPPTVGVEEEMFVVDGETGELRTDAQDVVDAARHHDDDQIDHELSRAQVESGSQVCRDLEDLRASLTSLRRRLDAAARARGARIIATGTHPWSPWSAAGGVTPVPAYLRLAEEYAHLTSEQVVSGCHVHVEVGDPDLAIQVMNRVRVHIPEVLALSTNSPLWEGTDTGYASYRTEVFHRWPTAGLPEPFASRADYDDLVRVMTDAGAIDEPARLYWDVRPSARYPTLEFRVADVPMTVDESVTLAGLCRALVARACAQEEAGAPMPRHRPEVLRSALWRAARYGLDAELLDLEAGRARPAADVVRDLVTALAPHLEEVGDRDVVGDGVEALLRDGTGAARQRAALARRDDPCDVVDLLVGATVP
ncbi:glutamate--cysteine ligase [Iamia majanohamensis]|uniref:Putative glutamate--cysteine ligase 2 n=1 Tax=Iamia majanohamensis TaxID=467976 RepID=A0AAF0BVQ8_9ACTN|nr:glutamate--cysteine ligase [Iamia majanohamensis]WCO66594.1 glutamate--cysteine ligase [Iamia majanohamensis]